MEARAASTVKFLTRLFAQEIYLSNRHHNNQRLTMFERVQGANAQR